MEAMNRTLWCPQCSRVARQNRWLKGLIAGCVTGYLVLIAAAAFGAVQNQTWTSDTPAVHAVWEPKQPGERWRDSYGAWLQELVGLVPKRTRYGIVSQGDGLWNPTAQHWRGEVTGVILDTHALVRCQIGGEWTDDQTTYCLTMGVLCDDGALTIGQTVCAPSPIAPSVP